MSDDTRRDRRGKSEPLWPSFALPRGTTVNGYRIDRVLGSGGFGITYLAFDLLEQRFAIKEYYPRQFAARRDTTVGPATLEDTPLFDECRERFLREAQALVLLGRVAGAGDGVVRVQTYFESVGTCFLVMDYVEGASLADVLRDEPAGLPQARVRSLLSQLLSSIRIVHQAGLVHRDIKPANIILRDDDRLVLIDFGATRQTTRGENTSYSQIYSGGYGPPEQMLGMPQGEFSDIYAIGAVCYRAIGGSVVNALARQNSLAAGRPDPQPPALAFGAGRYPRALLAAIDAALAVDPMQRPQNVDAMLRLLGPDEPIDMATIVGSARGTPARAPRSRRGMLLAAAGVGVLALAGVAYFMTRSPVAPPPEARTPPATLAAPTPPIQEPQREATATPTPPPTSVPSLATVVPVPAAPPPEPPKPAGNVAPEAQLQAVSPPKQEPEREAVAVLPPMPVPVPAPSPLEQARAAAGSLSCAALHVAAGPDRVRISGFAPAGQEFDRLLAGLRDAGKVSDDVTRVDRSGCAVIATVAPVVRRTWDGEAPAFAIRIDQPTVASGAHVGISVTTALPALYVDLYPGDGSVRHLLRPAQSGTTGRRTVDWLATPPSGTRLVVAIGAATPFSLGARPETERESDYLAALRPKLADAATPVSSDLAMVNVRAVEPASIRQPQPRSTNLRPEKCANIVSRAQLGETLSDAELMALRTECRS